jgi:O-antigen/teichoic acid export membrane protein
MTGMPAARAPRPAKPAMEPLAHPAAPPAEAEPPPLGAAAVPPLTPAAAAEPALVPAPPAARQLPPVGTAEPLPPPIAAPEPPPPRASPAEALLPRVRRWAGILSAYFSTQVLIQLAGIGAGLLFIRFLPVREFALYTLAFSIVTFFTFLTDLGSTGSLVHFFRLAAVEGDSFASYLAAVFSLRRTAFLAGAAGVVLFLPAAAAARGYSLPQALPVTLAVVLCVWFQLNAALRVLTLRLHDRYGRSYRAELAGGLTRLLLALALVVFTLLRAWLGVLSSAIASAVVGRLARPRLAPGGLAPAAPPDLRPYRRRVVRYLLPNLPSALYFAVQAPLVVWLSATFGSTRSVAEVGALGRLGLVVGLFSSLTGVVFMPRLARVADDRVYLLRYLQFGGFLALVAASLLAAAALVPGAFLAVLGPNYRGLHRELLLIIASSGLALLDGFALGVNGARSWNRWQSAALVVLLAVQVLAIARLPLSTTWHVLTFNLLTAAVGFVSQVTMNVVGFVRPRWVHWA